MSFHSAAEAGVGAEKIPADNTAVPPIAANAQISLFLLIIFTFPFWYVFRKTELRFSRADDVRKHNWLLLQKSRFFSLRFGFRKAAPLCPPIAVFRYPLMPPMARFPISLF